MLDTAISFAQAEMIVFESWRAGFESNQPRTPIGLMGPPGIGKTTTTRAAAQRIEDYVQAAYPGRSTLYRCLDLSSMLPEDLLGLPFRDGGVTRYAPQAWLAELCEDDAVGILCLDDIAASSPAVAVAARQMILEHRVHEHRLSPDVMITFTGNRRSDKSGARDLPAHFRNASELYTVKADLGVRDGEPEGWLRWAGQQPDIDPVVGAFLRFKPSRFSTLPSEADQATGAFATPRTWAFLGKRLSVARETGTVLHTAAGLVGQGAAVEFTAYVNVRAELPDPAAVLANPKSLNLGVLNSPDKVHAMCTALAEVAAEQSKAVRGRAARMAGATALLRATAHVTSAGGREYISLVVSTYLGAGGQMQELAHALSEAARTGDAEIDGLRQYIRKIGG